MCLRRTSEQGRRSRGSAENTPVSANAPNEDPLREEEPRQKEDPLWEGEPRQKVVRKGYVTKMIGLVFYLIPFEQI